MTQLKDAQDVPRRCKPDLVGLPAGCGDDGMHPYLACVSRKVSAGKTVLRQH